jgi:hypothetical protein
MAYVVAEQPILLFPSVVVSLVRRRADARLFYPPLDIPIPVDPNTKVNSSSLRSPPIFTFAHALNEFAAYN